MSESKQTTEPGATPPIEPTGQGTQEQQDTTTTTPATTTDNKKSKKKLFSRNKSSTDDTEQGSSSAAAGEAAKGTSHPALKSSKVVDSLLRMNPALGAELAGMSEKEAAEAVRKMNINELLTGLSLGAGGKNQKDMASYKFWATQPVPRFDEDKAAPTPDGPIKVIKPEEVSKEPDALIEGFEWVTLDLTDETELVELYELLTNHYVEDDNAMFRFNYSRGFLNWFVASSYSF
jgi:glycylpeptide N-tetradecanoyltransferase